MYYLGIDLGGTNIAAGVINEKYEIIGKAKCKTHVPCTHEELCTALAQAATDAAHDAGVPLSAFPWIGVGCPGTVNRKTGVLDYATNLFIDHFPVEKLLSEALGVRVIAANDAKAAAYGEFLAGALRGANDAIAVTLGTGIGCGIIIDKKIYPGTNDSSGEAGHTVIIRGGRKCACGREGCWERYASASGLILTTREEMEAHPESLMWELCSKDLKKVGGRTAFQAMRAGDEAGKIAVTRYLSDLSCGIINLVNIFQPDILCLGGGVCHEGEAILAPLRDAVDREQYAKHSEKKTVLCKAQLENDAGIIGAALLGI